MKELQKTPFINALLANAVGEGVDVSKLHVYEVRATSTIPLRGKTGTIFERAKISPHTIAQLARAVNEDPLPLMMDHDMRGTPYGKFFYGEAIPMETGETELRGYMYVDDSEDKIIAKLDAASVDEVSIQFGPEKILCSECAFDYKAAKDEGNYMPLLMLECGEGHKIGDNGVHANLVGVVDAIELSLVSRGAAKNSKIIAPSDAKLGQEAQRLAAHGLELDSIYCTASIGDEQGVDNVDVKEFATALTAAANDKIDLSAKLNTAEGQITTLEAAATAKDERIAALEAEVAELKGTTPEASAEDVAKLTAFIGRQYVALKALDGDTAAVASDKIEDMTKFIDENEARLTALIPAGGAALAANSGENAEKTAQAEEEARIKLQASAFKSPRK